MCYKVFTTAASYSSAKTQCFNLGSDSKLAAPKPAAVLTKLGELRAAVSADEKIWVGLDDRWVNSYPSIISVSIYSGTEGTFIFSDGTEMTKTGGDWGE
jgi:hypothetical protein